MSVSIRTTKNWTQATGGQFEQSHLHNALLGKANECSPVTSTLLLSSMSYLAGLKTTKEIPCSLPDVDTYCFQFLQSQTKP